MTSKLRLCSTHSTFPSSSFFPIPPLLPTSFFILTSSLLSSLPFPPSSPSLCLHFRDISKVMRVVQHPADFLPNPRRYISNYSLVHSVVHNLTPENCVIFIGTQNINSSSNLTLQQDLLPVQANGNKVPLPSLNFKEPIYSTPYTIYNIPEELLVYWNSSLANPELKLADPNMFVPDSTHLVLAPVSNQTVPQQLNSETTVETWVFPDTKSFYEPKVNLVCELKTANAEKTAYWEGEWRGCQSCSTNECLCTDIILI